MIPQPSFGLPEPESTPPVYEFGDNSLTIEADYEIVNDCDDLTELEQLELENCEKDIQSGIKSFYQLGKALLNIRDKQLYRQTHTTFADYCLERWDIPRSTAYQFIDAAVVVENVRNCGHFVPANEAQARPLVKLKTAQQQQQAWQRIVETAPGGKVTAKHVGDVVNDFKPNKEKKPFGKEYQDDSENGGKANHLRHRSGANIENSMLDAGDERSSDSLSLFPATDTSDICQEIITNLHHFTNEQVAALCNGCLASMDTQAFSLLEVEKINFSALSNSALRLLIAESSQVLSERHQAVGGQRQFTVFSRDDHKVDY